MSEKRERPSTTWMVGCLGAAAVIIAAIIGLGVPFAERLADIYFPTFTPIPNSSPPVENQYQTPISPSISATATVSITPYCPFVTQSQIDELKTIQGVETALSKIREFSIDSKYWKVGETVPANVVIATNLMTADYETYFVVPINNQGGWGLFYTTREITPPNDGAYWCVR